MRKSIFGPIVFGILIGAALFFMPFFVIKIILFALFIGAIIRMFAWRRYHWRGQYYAIYADKIRNMNEEEYKAFKEKMNRWNDCCYDHSHYCCDTSPAEKKEDTKESNNQNS